MLTCAKRIHTVKHLVSMICNGLLGHVEVTCIVKQVWKDQHTTVSAITVIWEPQPPTPLTPSLRRYVPTNTNNVCRLASFVRAQGSMAPDVLKLSHVFSHSWSMMKTSPTWPTVIGFAKYRNSSISPMISKVGVSQLARTAWNMTLFCNKPKIRRKLRDAHTEKVQSDRRCKVSLIGDSCRAQGESWVSMQQASDAVLPFGLA